MKEPIIRTPVPEIDPDPAEGLSSGQVRQRLEAGWANRPSSGALRSEKRIIAQHVFTFFNLVFAVLAVILVLVRSSIANFGFLGVVLTNLAVSTFQEIRAKRALEKLTLVAAQTLKTVRNGKYAEVRSHDLVRDDIVIFVAGNQICADAVVRSGTLQVNESLVTGEPDAITKQEGDELMSGSFVVSGSAVVQLIRVGDDSYAAKLAAEAKKNPKAAKSEMMRHLDQLIRLISIVLIPLGVLYFLGEHQTEGAGLRSAAEQTVAALVSMIPQGLYLLTTIALAVSSLKLARKKVLVQDINCIETLARVDVLCVDKTGTITEPGMALEQLIPLHGEESWHGQVLTHLFGTEPPENDTAAAIYELYQGQATWVCQKKVPFSSDYKWSGAVFNEGTFLTGAPERLLGSRYRELAETVEQWSRRGRRVLLLAGYEGDPQPGKLEEDRVTPLALLLLTGRIRAEARQTFRYFREQGVAIKVISGDSPATASAIAGHAGIQNAGRYTDCELLTTEEDFAQAVDAYTVFGRVTPEKKQSLIKALKAKGHTVAMTGDGVNDVLAMRQADCAVAMASGAQAASQVAQLVLLESDFSAMPHIVGEGRRVINNVQRAAALFLVKTVFTVAMVLLSLFTPLVYPFRPATLTVVTALTVGIPSFFFALEPNLERVTGSFLPGAFRRALPGGLTVFVGLVLTQLLAGWFGMTDLQMRTVCAATLACTGLQVLIRICHPLTTLRKIVLGAMAVGLVGAFTLLGPLFAVQPYDLPTFLLMLPMLAATAALFWGLSFVFDRLKKA